MTVKNIDINKEIIISIYKTIYQDKYNNDSKLTLEELINFICCDEITKSLQSVIQKDIETLEDGSLKITGEPTDYNAIKTAIENKLPDVEFDVDEIQTKPQETVELEGEDMVLFERLMNLLNDCDDVDQVYHNVSNYDDGEEE